MALLRRLSALRFRMAAVRNCSRASVPLKLSEEVRAARAGGRPLVALESTIITHGMPYPHNLETARAVEDIIRQRGATPATVAIIGGELHIGITDDQLTYLAQAKRVIKTSRRDLPLVMAGRQDGGTTVAGTIIAAELANIPVFVTGGIGGVHRDGENTLDVSADLTELGRSKTLVVCSGVKSILDIGRTLEYLETQGVCVCSFGESDDFPAFYTRRSGFKAPHKVANAEHAAKLIDASRKLKLSSGIVIAVPVPEEQAMDESLINGAIDSALREAKEKGVCGKEVTPFILAAVAAATAGASLETNIALIKNNAKVGADIAVEFNRLRNADNFNTGGVTKGAGRSPPNTRGLHTSPAGAGPSKAHDEFPMFAGADLSQPVLVIGGANVDRTYRVTEEHVQLDGSTHACTGGVCGGGVGRNMAEALWRLRGAGGARLLAAVAGDEDGRYVADIAPGMLLDGCVQRSGRTASYAAVLDARGECLLGLGDMSQHLHISVELVNKHMDVLECAPLVVLDGNAPQDTVDHVLATCNRLSKPVFFEPTDRRKAVKGVLKNCSITFASPNINELRSMAVSIKPGLQINHTEPMEEVVAYSSVVAEFVKMLIITLGPKGILITNKNGKELRMRLYPATVLQDVVNVSGAGDCFASGFIHGMLQGFNEATSVAVGFQAATAAIMSHKTVPESFSLGHITAEAKFTTIFYNSKTLFHS